MVFDDEFADSYSSCTLYYCYYFFTGKRLSRTCRRSRVGSLDTRCKTEMVKNPFKTQPLIMKVVNASKTGRNKKTKCGMISGNRLTTLVISFKLCEKIKWPRPLTLIRACVAFSYQILLISH